MPRISRWQYCVEPPPSQQIRAPWIRISHSRLIQLQRRTTITPTFYSAEVRFPECEPRAVTVVTENWAFTSMNFSRWAVLQRRWQEASHTTWKMIPRVRALWKGIIKSSRAQKYSTRVNFVIHRDMFLRWQESSMHVVRKMHVSIFVFGKFMFFILLVTTSNLIALKILSFTVDFPERLWSDSATSADFDRSILYILITANATLKRVSPWSLKSLSVQPKADRPNLCCIRRKKFSIVFVSPASKLSLSTTSSTLFTKLCVLPRTLHGTRWKEARSSERHNSLPAENRAKR